MLLKYGNTKVLTDSFLSMMLIVWFCLVASHVINMLQENTSVDSVKGGIVQHVDFTNWYMAGKLALSADRYRAYDPKVQLDWYNRVISPARSQASVYLQYPPYFFPLMIPVAMLPLRQSYITWNILSIIFGVCGLLVAAKAGAITNRYAFLIFLAGALASFPSCFSIIDGQFSWWFIGAIALFYWALTKKKDWLCALLFTLMTIKPHFAMFLLIPVLISRRKSLIAYIAMCMLVLMVLSGLDIGWANLLNYPQILMHAEVAGSMVLPERMVSIRGLISLFLPAHAAMLIGLITFGLAMIATTYYWWQALRKKTVPPQWALSITLLFLLIASPHTHLYDCSLLAIAAIITLPSIRVTSSATTSPLSLKIWSLLILSYPIVSWILMVSVPQLACRVLPQSYDQLLSVNNVPCGLLSFYAFLFFDILLLVCAICYCRSNHFARSSN